MKLYQYIEENGYEICGNIRETYIDGVWNKETNSDSREIKRSKTRCIPVDLGDG